MYYIDLFLKKEFEEKELILGNFKKPAEIIYSTNILEYINYGATIAFYRGLCKIISCVPIERNQLNFKYWFLQCIIGMNVKGGGL